MTITVFLLDDHEMVRRGLRDILATEDDIDVIGEAGTVDEGARGIVGMRPDVALVDVVLPDGNGVKVCEALRTYAPDVRTLVLTSFSDDDALRGNRCRRSRRCPEASRRRRVDRFGAMRPRGHVRHRSPSHRPYVQPPPR